jgi:hypothetical protein
MKNSSIRINDEVITSDNKHGKVISRMPRGYLIKIKKDNSVKPYRSHSISLDFNLKTGDKIEVAEHFCFRLNGEKGIIVKANKKEGNYNIIMDNDNISTPAKVFGSGRKSDWVIDKWRLRKI